MTVTLRPSTPPPPASTTTTTTAPTNTNTSTTRSTGNNGRMYNFVTKSKSFRKLTKWAFDVCDGDKTGQIGKSELYAGILLVHVNLAKYAGAAACYPPTRQVIDELFEASDDDNSGTIDEHEFTQIMVICCAQIMSRMFVYYGIIILLVPYVADIIIDGFLPHIENIFGWKTGIFSSKDNYAFNILQYAAMTVGEVAERMVSLTLFFLVVPLFFNYIDLSSRNVAETTRVVVGGPPSRHRSKNN